MGIVTEKRFLYGLVAGVLAVYAFGYVTKYLAARKAS